MAELLKATGERVPLGERVFTLDELQTLVGGYIEVCWLGPTRVLVINEEGKLRGLPKNEAATALYRATRRGGYAQDWIVGDAVLASYPTEVD